MYARMIGLTGFYLRGNFKVSRSTQNDTALCRTVLTKIQIHHCNTFLLIENVNV